MTQYTLSTSAWTKIASAGTTVEVQNLSTVAALITISGSLPSVGTDGEVIYATDPFRKYDSPLPFDLYACALTSAPTAVEVLPIGASGDGENAALAQLHSDLTAPTPAGSNLIGSVMQAGSNGTDYSANKPSIPNVGAAFAASGPYASYVLVATVPASGTRNNVDVENSSGGLIAIVRDDGSAAVGAVPVNASVFSLAGGSGVGTQGGSWSSTSFRGRLQVYAASAAASIAVFID